MYTLVPNIIEANGKTVRENNLAIQHTIPLGTLVEVDCDTTEEHTLRLYVVAHTRDCDGTPLYGLHHKRDIIEHIADIENLFVEAYTAGMKATISNGWDVESLNIIRLPVEE